MNSVQENAVSRANYSLLTRLMGLLVKKGVISETEATEIVRECANAHALAGDPVNEAAAELLRQHLAQIQPPGSKSI